MRRRAKVYANRQLKYNKTVTLVDALRSRQADIKRGGVLKHIMYAYITPEICHRELNDT